MKRPDTRPMRKTRSQDMNGAGPNQPGDGGFGGLTTRLAKKENEPNRLRFRHQNRDGPALEDPNFLHREVTSAGPNQTGLGEASPLPGCHEFRT